MPGSLDLAACTFCSTSSESWCINTFGHWSPTLGVSRWKSVKMASYCGNFQCILKGQWETVSTSSKCRIELILDIHETSVSPFLHPTAVAEKSLEKISNVQPLNLQLERSQMIWSRLYTANVYHSYVLIFPKHMECNKLPTFGNVVLFP